MTNDNRRRGHGRDERADKRPEGAPAGDICWGRNPVIALLEGDPERCMKVLIAKSAQPHIKAKITELCRAYTAQMKLWEPEELLASLPAAPSPALILLCDHLQDPHNLGAVIRSAEAAGAAAVMIPKRGGCLPTGTVVKTSAGAALRLPVVKVGNVSQTIKMLQEADFWVTGLAMEGRDTLFREDLPPRSAIVVGAEGEGLGNAVAKACDDIRFIPMQGTTGSLNASVAASIAMFEWTRSLGKNNK